MVRNRKLESDFALCDAHYDQWFTSVWKQGNASSELACNAQRGPVPCDIFAVLHDMRCSEALVCLVESNGARRIAVGISWPERHVLSWMLKREQLIRPYTHQAMASAITQLGGIATHGMIDFADHTSSPPLLHAKVFIRHGNKDVQIDVRPSDMFILAVILNFPISVESLILDSQPA